MKSLIRATVILLITAAYAEAQATSGSCEALAKLAIPEGKIMLAELIAAGTFVQPRTDEAPSSRASVFRDVPAFCRVAATLTPTTDSEIRVEVWMPASSWNGKFQAVGNGGWSGSISYPALGRAVARGYASASTDTGHQGGTASFAIGHPEKLIDFGYRAVHLMTIQAKALIGSYYGTAPKYSYWNGCSSGGKQGLKEAQRFPQDFDGIIAGAPANNWIRQKAAVVNVNIAVHKDPESYIPPAKYPIIHRAVLAACDALDGVKDGLIESPLACNFDPKVLECKEGGDAPDCLTPKQVVAAQTIYAAAKNPRTGEEIFPGLTRGSELSWDVQAGPEPRGVAYDLWAFVVFQDPKWNYMTLDLDRDVAKAEAMDAAGPMMAATDPNLTPFFGRG
jgi:feruloyl esterase